MVSTSTSNTLYRLIERTKNNHMAFERTVGTNEAEEMASTFEGSEIRQRRLGKLIAGDIYEGETNNPNILTAKDVDLSSIAEPAHVPGFNVNADYERLQIAGQDTLRTLLQGAIYSGVRIGNDAAKPWARLGKEFSPDDSHFYVTGEFSAPKDMETRRLSLRVIPEHWSSPNFDTPFSVHGSGDVLEVVNDYAEESIVLGSIQHLLPLDSPRTIAYRREGRRNGDNGIVINPIMTCPHRCGFCSRQYDSLNHEVASENKLPLAQFSPKEIVDYAAFKYPDTNWRELERVSLVTGSFNTFEDLHTYLDGMGKALYEKSNGEFNPAENENQEILVLTHLARTRSDFEQLKELGVALQDTIEILDDDRRHEHMPVAHTKAIPKFAYSQEDILGSIPVAVDVLGTRDYRATLILGLDDFETTRRGLIDMRSSGLRRLYTPAFQPYGIKDHALYKMTFLELAKMRSFISQTFDRVY
jgi:hypothetical protein